MKEMLIFALQEAYAVAEEAWAASLVKAPRLKGDKSND